MEFEYLKEQIKNKLEKRNCLTRQEISEFAEGDETLVIQVYRSLISDDKIAIQDDDGNLQFILNPAKKKDTKDTPEVHLVFMSYGRECKGIKLAYRLCKDLEDQANYKVWIDVREIHEGDPWDVCVEEGIDRSRTLIAILTPHSIRKKSVCRDEIHFALLYDKNIIPIKGDPDPKATQLRLVRRHYLDFSKDAEYEVNFKRLLLALSGDRSSLIKPIPKIADEEPFDFGREIALFSNNFTGREWIKEEIDSWLSNPNDKQIFLITGDIGSGKSAIAAWLSQVYSEQAVGIHFCLRNSEKNFPYKFVISIAAQLSEKLKGYKEIIEQKDHSEAAINASDAFRKFIIDPVCSRDLVVPEKTAFLIVDALDESKLQKEGSETIFSIIDDQSKFLPSWLRIIATSRPKPFIKDVMSKNSRILDMKKKRRYHDTDIRKYLEEKFSEDKLRNIVEKSGAEKKDIIDIIVKRSKGIFLYAVLAVNCLSEGKLTPDKPEDLPPTISGFFLIWFEQIFPHDEDFEKIRPVLEVICFAREPLSAEEIAFFCGKSTYDVKKLLMRIEDFIPLNEAKKFQPFHIAFIEWLKGELGECSKYSIDPEEGARMLADGCYKEYEGGVTFMKPYAFNYIALHLLEAGQEDQLTEVMADPSYFMSMWRKDEFKLKANWVQIEKKSNLRILKVYEQVLHNPAGMKNDEFIYYLSEFFDDIERRRQAISLFEYLIHQSIEKDDKMMLENVLSSVAFSLYLVNKSDIALQILKISEYLSKVLDDNFGLQKSYFYQATIGDEQDPDTALILYHLQQKICEGLDDAWTRAYWLQLSYGNEGHLLARLGYKERAMKLFKLKEEKCQEMGIKQGLQWAFGWQAENLALQEKIPEALELFKAQEKIAEDIGYKRGLERTLEFQNFIFKQQDNRKQQRKTEDKIRKLKETDEITIQEFNYKKIIDHLKEYYTTKLFSDKDLHKPKDMIQNLGILSLVHEIEGDVSGSLEYLQTQEQLCRKHDQTVLTISLIAQLRILGNNSEYEKAINGYHTVLKQELSYRDFIEIHIILLIIAKKIAISGDYKQACIFFRETWKHYLKIKDFFNELATTRYVDLLSNVMKISSAYSYKEGRFHDSIVAAEELEKFASSMNNINNHQYAVAYLGLSTEAQGYFENALSLYIRQAQILGEGGDFRDLAGAITNQGDVLRKLGKQELAMAKYHELKDISEKNHSNYWLVCALENIGSIMEDTGDLDHALDYYREAESISRKENSGDIPYALERQGDILLRKGDLSLAFDLFRELEADLSSTDNIETLSRAIGYQSMILHIKGMVTRSLEFMKKKATIISSISPDDWHARMMKNQDYVHRLGRETESEYLLFQDDSEFIKKSFEIPRVDLDSSYRSLFDERVKKSEIYLQRFIDYYSSLEKKCEHTGFRMGLQYAVGNKGIIWLLKGDYENAAAAFSQMENICKEIKYRYGLQLAYGRQGVIFQIIKEYEKALEISYKQEAICRELNLLEDLAICLGRQASLLYHLGNYSKSLNLFRKQEDLSSERGLLYWKQKSVEGQGKTYLKMNNFGEAINSFVKQENICRLIGDPRLICLSLMNKKQLYDLIGENEHARAAINEINLTTRLFS